MTFFGDLPATESFLELTDRHRYHPVPSDHLVIVTDVISSSVAIEAGRYRDVNVIGGASIAAVLNACDREDLPYSFRGDGSFVVVPPERRGAVARALNQLVTRARGAFDLELRIGAVPVHQLRDEGADVLVARHALSDAVALGVFAGTGLERAAALVKDPGTAVRYTLARQDVPEATSDAFAGLRCRWEPLPSRNGEILSVVVRATGESAEAQLEVYAGLVALVETLGEQARRPVSDATLKLATDMNALDAEARLHTGKRGGVGRIAHEGRMKAIAHVGSVILDRGLRFKDLDGATYREAFVRQSDFRKLDGSLRMVLDVTPYARAAIEERLEAELVAGELVYGVDPSRTATVTCLIWDYASRHVHFIDGSEGGYSRAAAALARRAS